MPRIQWMRSRKSRKSRYINAITSLSPLLWYKFNETNGTAVTNYGSLGSPQNGVWAAGIGAVGQVGQLGSNQAYLFDGIDSIVVSSATPSINNLTAFTYAILMNATTAGEINQGVMFSDTAQRVFRFNNASYAMRAFVGGGAGANTVTANGFVTSSTWSFLFMTYDDAGDRKVHLYKGVGGIVTEASYTTQTALGVALSNGSGDIQIGNNAAVQTHNGLIDEALVFSSVLTTAQMLSIVQATGV